MNNWRLVSEIKAYIISGTNKVYLAAPEKKLYSNIVVSQIESEYTELHLFENNFKVYLDGLTVYISSPGLPDKYGWYEARNFWEPGIADIIRHHTLIEGKLDDQEFEVIFNSDIPEKFSLISIKYPEYQGCLDEMERRLNCEMCKKTKTWIPGHRYDTLEKSVYYLFPISLRKGDTEKSEYLETTDKEVYVCLEHSPGKLKSISEVLSNISFSSLHVYTSKYLSVDAGECLENNFTNYQDYLEDLTRNTYQEDLGTFLDIFSIGEYTISEKIKGLIEDKIKDSLKDIIIKNWGVAKYRSDQEIGDSVKTNIENLKKLLFSYIDSKNLYKSLYYQKLFDVLGISLNELVDDSISSWRSINLKENFETYLEYLEYFKIRSKNPISKQRDRTARFKTDTNNSLQDIFGCGPLTETIIELLRYTETNCGYGITEYQKVNVGTKKNPLRYITAKITLEDIIKYKKGVSGMSENLKNDILRYSFVSVVVVFDENGKLE